MSLYIITVCLIEWSVSTIIYVCTYLHQKTEKRKYFIVRTQLYNFCEVNELSTKIKSFGQGHLFLEAALHKMHICCQNTVFFYPSRVI